MLRYDVFGGDQPNTVVQQIEIPAHFYVTKNDKIAVPKKVRNLFKEYKGTPKKFTLLEGEHNSVRMPEFYQNGAKFLREVLKTKGQQNRLNLSVPYKESVLLSKRDRNRSRGPDLQISNFEWDYIDSEEMVTTRPTNVLDLMNKTKLENSICLDGLKKRLEFEEPFVGKKRSRGGNRGSSEQPRFIKNRFELGSMEKRRRKNILCPQSFKQNNSSFLTESISLIGRTSHLRKKKRDTLKDSFYRNLENLERRGIMEASRVSSSGSSKLNRTGEISDRQLMDKSIDLRAELEKRTMSVKMRKNVGLGRHRVLGGVKKERFSQTQAR